MATLLCQKCELQFDDGLRLPKVLPCGHTACLACLKECARTGGRMCPVCRKVFKSNLDELVTLQNPKANRVWCRDCEAEAKAACFEQHELCGLGRMQKETTVELEAAWADRAALLHTLAEDVRAEKQQLKQERDSGSQQQQQRGLAALRGVLAAAKEHPLHGLPAGHDGEHAQGRLLHRALVTLRMEEELRAREAAVRDKEATLAEREAAVQDKEATLAEREAALDKRASPRIRRRRLAAQGLQRVRNRGSMAPSEGKKLESATAAQASFCSDDSSDISSEEGDNAEGQPVRRLPVRQPVPTNESSTGSSDESIALEPALPRQAPEVASADSSFDSVDGSEVSVAFGELTPSPSASSGAGSDRDDAGAEKPSGSGLDSSFQASSSDLDDSPARVRDDIAEPVMPSPRESQPSSRSSYDSDGSATGNDERPAPTVPGMDSLSEELLQRILALVPLWWKKKESTYYTPPVLVAPDLLSLRLVCRRWARSVLSPDVWRHRELDYNLHDRERPGHPFGVSLLQQVPAVDTLTCHVDSNKKEELRILENSSIRVRSLNLSVGVSNVSCSLVKRLLIKKPCEELRLQLWRKSLSLNKTTWLLQHVDSMQGLKAFTLEHGAFRYSMSDEGKLKHTFQHLPSLTKLSLRRYLHLDTVRSMLEASKLTLRELDCGDYDIAHLVASTASQLRYIRVAGCGISENLMHLRELEHLEVAQFTLEAFSVCFTRERELSSKEQSEILSRFLNSSPTVPREVHLIFLKGSEPPPYWNTVDVMRRVSHLTIVCSSYFPSAGRPDNSNLTVPLTLPDVVKLEIDVGYNEDAVRWWQGWLSAWQDSTAPKLREVHVVHSGCLSCIEWLRLLRVKRRHVKIYFKK